MLGYGLESVLYEFVAATCHSLFHRDDELDEGIGQRVGGFGFSERCVHESLV